MKRILSFVLMMALLVGMLPGVLAAGPQEPEAVTYQDSGFTNLEKPSLTELQQLFAAIPDYGTDLYAVTPVVSASGYKVGRLSDKALNHADKLMNLYRRIAGLTPVTFSAAANESSSWGALLLAMTNEFSHYPSKPSGMSDADYQKGYFATSHSNISALYTSSSGFVQSVIFYAISGQMDDSDANNIDVLGHRRWLLNPAVTTLGIGSASTKMNGYNAYYTDVTVFGTYAGTQTAPDYNFIAWPASGMNLSEFFLNGTPWSVTLNPKHYQTPNAQNLTVTLTRTSDGKTWTFTNSTGNSYGDDLNYFNVNNGGYGVANCIIFRPSPNSVGGDYSGTYTVRIQGLKTDTGAATELNYRVSFGSADDICVHGNTTVQGKKDATCTEKGYSGDTVCLDCGVVITAGRELAALGHDWNRGEIIVEAVGEEAGLIRYTCTRCLITREEVYHNCPGEAFTDMPKYTNWAHKGIDYCLNRGLMTGTSATTFAPKTPMSRSMLVTVLYRMDGQPGAGEAAFSDVPAGKWFSDAVSWAADHGIVTGVGGGRFDPNGNVTREQIATILFRYAAYKEYDTASADSLTGFADAETVGKWFVDGVKWAVAEGLLNGSARDGSTYLDPQDNATREQVAAILMRFCENVAG